ncbi:MAG: hypothetical protein ACP5QK_09750 [Myxococcota bacterium]
MNMTKRDGKFITLITSGENSSKIINELKSRFNIDKFFYNSARGLTVVDSRLVGKFFYVEKSIQTILLTDDLADTVFEFLYNYLDISNRPGSFMYMGEIRYLTELNLPDQILQSE